MQVLYFSLWGTTKKAAEQISELTGAKLTELKVQNNYPADLDEMKPIVLEEQKNQVLPTIENTINIEDDDIIFIGHPVWNQQLPPVVPALFKQVDFTGKKIIEFITSGSTEFSEIAPQFEKVAKTGTLQPGFRANDEQIIKEYLEQHQLLK